MQSRSIIHIDLDAFFVACERLLDSSLNGYLVLVGGTSGRGVVAACRYEARAYGIHSGMPMRMAQQPGPAAPMINGNASIYMQCSALITEITM